LEVGGFIENPSVNRVELWIDVQPFGIAVAWVICDHERVAPAITYQSKQRIDGQIQPGV